MYSQDYIAGQNNGLILGLSLGITETGEGGDFHPAPKLIPAPDIYNQNITVQMHINEGLQENANTVIQFIEAVELGREMISRNLINNASVELFNKVDRATVRAFYYIDGKLSDVAEGVYTYKIPAIRISENLSFDSFTSLNDNAIYRQGGKSAIFEQLTFPAFVMNEQGVIV